MEKIGDILKSATAKIIAFAGFYLCDIILARGLSIGDYAQWALFFSLTCTMLWISHFGIALVMRTIVAREKESDARQHYINCGIILRLAISILFVVIFVAASRPIAEACGWPGQYPDLLLLIRVGCALPLFMAFTNMWKDIFIGCGKMRSLLVMAINEHGGYAIGCLLGIIVFGNVYGALGGYYFGYMLSALSGFILDKTSFHEFDLSPKTKKDVLMIFRGALPFVVTCIITFLILEMDTLMLGMFQIDSAELSNYTVAKKFIQKAISVNEVYLYVMLPRFAVIGANNVSDSWMCYNKIKRTNFFITCGVGLGMALILTALVPIIYGCKYDMTGAFIVELIPVYIFHGLSQCHVQFLYYRGKAKVVSACYSLSFMLNLTLNWLLIPRLGALGAAAGTALSLAPFAVMLAIASRKEWKRLANSTSC